VISDASNAPFVMDSQFAAGGLNAGQTVYFYSLERPKEEVVEEVKSFLTKEVIAKLVYFDAFSVRLKGLSAAQMKKLGVNNHAVDVTQDVVPRMLQEAGATPFRIIIESLTEAIDSYGPEAVMKMVETVTGITRKMNAVTLMSIEKGVADSRFEARLRHLVDGLIEFGVDRQGFGLYSYISISKMRGITDATKLLLYKETEKGLWLESTRRVQ
jgi:KaiC/GvpD/RAD55 family RecA-like ATPase